MIFAINPYFINQGLDIILISQGQLLPNKSVSESAVEDGVYDGVDGGGHVAQPEADVDHVIRYVTLGTRCEQDVQHEEGRPAEHEGEEH